MKVEMQPRLAPRRGSAPKEGNVYVAKWGRYYKIVLGIVKRDGNRPWSNIVMLHVDSLGEICGCSREPEIYVQNHQDLVGRVVKMPTFKIEWLKGNE